MRRDRLTRRAVFERLRRGEKFLAKYRKSLIGLAGINKLVGRDRLTNLFNSSAKKHRMYPFGHIDLRVHDLEPVYPFYARILAELGFRNEWRGEGAFSFQAEGRFPKLSWFGVIEDRNHIPNATRIAFAVESCKEVDRLAEIVRSAGAINIEGPEDMPYTRIYYAVYFEDPSGNRLEIYYCEE